MQSKFRLRAASAAILLAALGAGFVAAPASAEPVVVARSTGQAGGLLHRFEVTVNQTGMRPGITYRVYGVPNANVIVDLPGIGPVTASEVQPGTYEAGLSLRRGERNVFPPATAVLRINSSQEIARIPAINAGDPNLAHAVPVPVQPGRVVPVPPPQPRDERAQRDQRGPEIFKVTPAQGDRVSERGRTRVNAEYRDDKTGIDRKSVRLRVDGRDVTADTRINDFGVEYFYNPAPGTHTAELTVRDRNGNATRRTWTFEVVDAGRGNNNTRPGNGWGDRNHEHTGSRGDGR